MDNVEERRERQEALDEAVRDTREPQAASQARESDDERTRARQAADSAALRSAADVLNENKARLRQTGAELRERGRELDRTGNLVRDVQRNTAELRSTNPRTRKTDSKK